MTGPPIYLRLVDITRSETLPDARELSESIRAGLRSTHQRSVVLASELLLTAASRSEIQVEPHLQDLRAAYEPFLHKPLQTDPGCDAKTAIVDALRTCGFDDEEFFRTSICYRQFEPTFGGNTDTAAKLRALSGFALASISPLRAINPLVELLLDTENTARAGAARALASCDHSISAPILRVKLAFGDDDPEVLGEVCAAYLAIVREAGIPHVEAHLHSSELDHRLETVFALGESRLPQALDVLKKHVRRLDSREEARVTLTAIALLQDAEALTYLLSQLEPDSTSIFKAEAIRALGHSRDAKSVASRIREHLDRAEHVGLDRVFDEVFGETLR